MIPSKQIGWSQESNLLYEILKKTDKLIQVSSQSNSPSPSNLIEDITYNSLSSKILSSSLTPGKFYQITDYATTYWMLDGNGNLIEANPQIGTLEPLVVTATSSNTLAKEAYSPLFPNDIIWYDWNPLNYEYDYGFFASGDLPDWKGVITYREDTRYNNSCGYDFRNVKFRRWEATADDWASETYYSINDKVKYNGYIYKCIYANSDVSFTAANWVQMADLSDPYFVLNASGDFAFNAISDSYQDYYTFYLDDETVFNNKIEPYQDDNGWWSITYSRLVNIVFNGEYCTNNTILSSCGNMTFKSNCYSNYFKTGNYNNTFSDYNNSNTFGNNNFSNTFGNGNYSNTFGNSNIYNTFGNVNNYNTFGNVNSYNTFGNGNSYNTFGNGSCYNTFGNGNSSNTFGSYDEENNFIGIIIVENTFKNAINGTGVDYSLATHLIGSYDCTIFKRSDGAYRLTYYDENDQLIITDVNS